jgi:hypothetical protein
MAIPAANGRSCRLLALLVRATSLPQNLAQPPLAFARDKLDLNLNPAFKEQMR